MPQLTHSQTIEPPIIQISLNSDAPNEFARGSFGIRGSVASLNTRVSSALRVEQLFDRCRVRRF
jgi:hypothetical protein